MDYSQAFEKIRDIPYHLPCESDATDTSCIGKHQKLKSLLEERGARVRYRVGIYSWDDLALPDEILALPHAPQTMHVFLELFHHDQWHVVDATWDMGLRQRYPLNEWQDFGSMQYAFPLRSVFSPQESNEIMTTLLDDDTSYMFTHNEFLETVNQWHERQRLR